MKKQLCCIALSFVLAGVMACNKDATTPTQEVNIYLTDAPADYSAVNIDLRQVNIGFADDTAWTAVPTTAGVYNLLSLQNGVSKLIASGTVPDRPVREVRLVLGDNNTIVADGETHSLFIPSASQSGLKVKLDTLDHVNLQNLTVDFDAALSVHRTGNGQYMLRPVIRVKE